ncbi:unnamed protein product, partial [marine sediment metagenome]
MFGVKIKIIVKKSGLTYGGYFGMIFEMPDDKRSDEVLVKACQQNDASALEMLFDRYKVPLRNYIRSRCWLRDASLIDTILEEVYVFIFKTIRKRKFTPTYP